MTVEVYKPALKLKPVPLAPARPVMTGRKVSRAVIDAPSRKDRLDYTPIKPRIDLALGIEDMTHPDVPSFAELEALIMVGLS
ncbi:MAG: hypothetical protein AAFR12_23290 [Cyanobacteria bacterium J06626_6]